MSFSKKFAIGIIFLGALAFYVAPVFAADASPVQTKSYCWLEKDCKSQGGTWSAEKSGDCLSNYGYCAPKEEAINLQIPIGGLTNVTSLEKYIPAIYNYLVAIVGIVAIVMIMVGGLQYLTAGSSGRIAEAKTRIIGAVIGLIVALSAYTILQTINPALISGKIPTKLKMIAPQLASQWCPNTNVKNTDYTGEFECGKKYGPNNTKTGKTGKTVPVSSGYCNGTSCEKKNNTTQGCYSTYLSQTPQCLDTALGKALKEIERRVGLCSGTFSQQLSGQCSSRIIISMGTIQEYNLKNSAVFKELFGLGSVYSSFTSFGSSQAEIQLCSDSILQPGSSAFTCQSNQTAVIAAWNYLREAYLTDQNFYKAMVSALGA